MRSISILVKASLHSSTEKKKVPQKGHFKLTGSSHAALDSIMHYCLLVEEFFNRAVMKKPGEKVGNAFVISDLSWGSIDVQSADRIQLASVVRTESHCTFVLDPLCASWRLAFDQLFAHLIQNIPRFRHRVGAAPIA